MRIVAIYCLLTRLPGPPQLHWSNLTFQTFPINRRICPEFDIHMDTVFHLYKRENADKSQVIIPYQDDSLRQSGIDFSLKTVIFFHGFLESYRSDDAQSIKNAYLEQGYFNIILVQSERLLAGPDYFTAAKNCQPIAKFSAQFIDYLVSQGLYLKDLHVIGLSLGGQIAGMTGQFVTGGRLPRITALDPAGPLFNTKPIDERIDPSDAEFVDVIFTNSGTFGMKSAVGHVNFWPNGGKKQPGCRIVEVILHHGLKINWIVFCSHYRSYQLYAESLRYPKGFPSEKCQSYKEYKRGLCHGNSTAYLGVYDNSGMTGNYYIDTGNTGLYVG